VVGMVGVRAWVVGYGCKGLSEGSGRGQETRETMQAAWGVREALRC
jgi:hypothetical protein